MQQRHPTSEQVTKVIENFKKVLPIANGHTHLLNMQEARVNLNLKVGEECGTPMCHAGWYALAVKDELPTDRGINFQHGKILMSKHLGFEELGDYDVSTWAYQNPDIWGNNYGSGMFCDPEAFVTDKRPNYWDLSLQSIVDHWTDVRDRLIELEKNPNYNNDKETDKPY